MAGVVALFASWLVMRFEIEGFWLWECLVKIGGVYGWWFAAFCLVVYFDMV